jgi:hypothetical protein
MPKAKKKIKVRDQKPLKDVKGGRHHTRRITEPGGGGRNDPPNISHL